MAFDDDLRLEENILLMRAEEGYTAHHDQGKWLLSREDMQVKQAIERAKGGQRIVEVKHTEGEHNLALTGRGYRTHPTSIAILGDQAGPYSDYLVQQHRDRGNVFMVSPEQLRKIGVTRDVVEIRSVVLSGGNSIATILVDQYLHQVSAHARGVYLRSV